MWERLDKLTKEKTPIILFGNEPFSSYLRTSNIYNYKYDWIWKKNKSTGFLNAKIQPLRIYENIHVFYKKQCLYNPQKTEGHKPVNFFTKNTSDGETMGKTKLGISGGGQTDRYPKNIIKLAVVNNDNSNGDKYHPTQKPLELLDYLIKTYTKNGDLILDFTAGSFTTCLSAERLDRRSIGIELSKKDCDIGIKRLSNLQLRFDI
jgi:site-specific DNA-methyltransferase (adenine-specific)